MEAWRANGCVSAGAQQRHPFIGGAVGHLPRRGLGRPCRGVKLKAPFFPDALSPFPPADSAGFRRSAESWLNPGDYPGGLAARM